MMRTIWRCAIGVLVSVCFCRGQEWGDRPPLLTEFRDDIEYAELLNAAQLAQEQLEELHGMQGTYLDVAVLTPEAADAFDDLRSQILAGKTNAQAMATLGPMQQTVNGIQGNVQRTLQDLAVKFRDKLTEEQRVGMFLFNSPARALTGVAQGLSWARKAPDTQWQRFRTNMTEMLHRVCLQAGEKGTTTATIEGLLDAARTMDDAEFQTAKETLVKEWAELLMPGLVQRASDARIRDEQLVWMCTRLISYSRGESLVETKLESMQKQ